MNSAKNDRQLPGMPAAQAGPPAGSGRPRRWSRRVAAAVSACALVGGGVAIGVAVTGGAAAATGGGTAEVRQCAGLAAQLRGGGHRMAARRVSALCAHPLLRLAAVGGMHGQVTFGAKGEARTLAFERGTVESAGASTITVRAADGTTWTWTLTGHTVVRQAGHRVAAASLAKGDRVFVGGPVVSGADDARLIRIRRAA
jgi:hypothetical protein